MIKTPLSTMMDCAGDTDLSDYYTKSELDTALGNKQNTLNAPSDANKILNGNLQWVDMPSGSGGSGGSGGMSMTVIDYDPTLPANQISETLTLADFVPVDGSAIIDAVNHQFKPDVAMELNITQPYPQDSQYVAIRLDKIPQHGTLRLDYSQYTEYTLAVVFRQNTSQPIESFLSDWLFGYWGAGSHPNYDAASLINRFHQEGEYTSNQWRKASCEIDLSTGDVERELTYTDITEIENKNLTFNFGTGLDTQLEQLGMTLEEFIDYALGMGMTQEEITTFINQARQKKYLYTGNITLWLPSKLDEMYLVLAPIYNSYYAADREPLTIDPDWTASVEMNTTYISGWKVPDDVDDGTYLKITGDCTLLGYTCTTGDVVQVYDNATKGLLFRGAAV